MPKNNSKARREQRAGEAKERNAQYRHGADGRLRDAARAYIRAYPGTTIDELFEYWGVTNPNDWRRQVMTETWNQAHAPRRVTITNPNRP